MANTTEQLINQLRNSKMTVYQWQDGKLVATYPQSRKR